MIQLNPPSLTAPDHTAAWRWLARDLADQLKDADDTQRETIKASLEELDTYLMTHAA